jgi:hypothetical protein
MTRRKLRLSQAEDGHGHRNRQLKIVARGSEGKCRCLGIAHSELFPIQKLALGRLPSAWNLNSAWR